MYNMYTLLLLRSAVMHRLNCVRSRLFAVCMQCLSLLPEKEWFGFALAPCAAVRVQSCLAKPADTGICTLSS